MQTRCIRNLVWLAICTMGVSIVVAAQDQKPQSNKPAGEPKTVVGCLTGYEGRYTLGASNDTLYLLDGDPAEFKRYNAKLVQATGTISEPPAGPSPNNVLSQQPPTLTVSKFKKVADGCN